MGQPGANGGTRKRNTGSGRGGKLRPSASLAARLTATGAVLAAVIVVAVLVLTHQSSYTVKADFQNASGLVTGNNVLIGTATVGSVKSIGLTPNGQAVVAITLHGTGHLHQGTVARIYEDSLSGIASKYVELEPGPTSGPEIHSGGTIGEGHTYSEVNIDELFDTFDAKTRKGLSNLIRGEAASLKGGGKAANRTLEYLAPGLQSLDQVSQELTRNEPAFDGLVIQGAKAMQALASKSTELTQLIANTNKTAGTIASQSQALQASLDLLPGTLTKSATTFAGLDRTLDSLDPVVKASKPNLSQLAAFATGLNGFSVQAIPTVTKLNALISNPDGSGDLTSLAKATPSLAAIAERAFPELAKNFNTSIPQQDALREYAPDVVAGLTNVGQAAATYDAQGHYLRIQPALFAFTTDSSGQLVQQFPADRYAGLQHVLNRCPGAAIQPSPDGSTPEPVTGCSTASVPPGP